MAKMISINVFAEYVACLFFFRCNVLFHGSKQWRNPAVSLQNIFLVFICEVLIPPDVSDIGFAAKGNKERVLLDKHRAVCVYM